MKPVSPIIPGANLPVTTYAEDQPEYNPLPVWRGDDGTVLSRWHCDWRERLRILITGDVYLWQMTFNQPLQPISMEAQKPKGGAIKRKWLYRLQWEVRFYWGIGLSATLKLALRSAYYRARALSQK